MEKKAKAKKTKGTGAKKGKYVCNEFGLVVSVDNACSCDPCDVMCCGENMQMMVC